MERWSLGVLASALVIRACASDPETADGLLALPDADDAILVRVLDDYLAHRGALGEPAARDQALTALRADPVVAAAALLEDGTTLLVRFADGEQGGLDTLDLAPTRVGLDAFMATLDTAPDGPADRDAFHLFDPYGGAPAHARALFIDVMRPDYPEDARIIQTASRYLTEAGWSPADIVVKARTSVTDKSLTPDDFFALGDYGLITIFAHGRYGNPAAIAGPGSPDWQNPNPYHYLQCCSAGDYRGRVSEKTLRQWRAWYADGKLVFIRSAGQSSIYIRSDLLGARAGPLPLSIVHLASCFGWHARLAFLGAGAGAFSGWDEVTHEVAAYSALLTLYRFGVRHAPVQSLQQIFANPVFTDVSEQPGRIHLETVADPFHFPTWAEVSLQPTSVPAGTAKATVDVTFAGHTDPITSFTMAPDGVATVADLAPASAHFKASALDASGALLANGTAPAELTPGRNKVVITLGSPAQEGVLRVAAYDDPPAGSLRYFVWVTWQAVEGASYYSLVGDSHGHPVPLWGTSLTIPYIADAPATPCSEGAPPWCTDMVAMSEAGTRFREIDGGTTLYTNEEGHTSAMRNVDVVAASYAAWTFDVRVVEAP